MDMVMEVMAMDMEGMVDMVMEGMDMGDMVATTHRKKKGGTCKKT